MALQVKHVTELLVEEQVRHPGLAVVEQATHVNNVESNAYPAGQPVASHFPLPFESHKVQLSAHLSQP